MAAVPSTSEAVTILRNAVDWPSWLNQAKGIAHRYELWDLIQPTSTVPFPQRPQPIVPAANYLSDSVAQQTFAAEVTLFNYRNQEFKDFASRLEKLSTALFATVTAEIKARIPQDIDLREWIKALQSHTQGSSPFALVACENRWLELTSGARCLSTALSLWLDEILFTQATLLSFNSTLTAGYTGHIRVCNALAEAGYNVDYYKSDLARKYLEDPAATKYGFAQLLAELRFVLPSKSSGSAAPVTFQGNTADANKLGGNKELCDIHGETTGRFKHVTKNCRLLKRAFKNEDITKASPEVQTKVTAWLLKHKKKAADWFVDKEGDKADKATDKPMVTTLSSSVSTLSPSVDISNAVILDSGATDHICNNWARFEPGSITKLKTPYEITSGGNTVNLQYSGTMKVNVRRPSGAVDTLHTLNAYFWPELHTSLVSQSIMMEKGWTSQNPLLWQDPHGNKISLTMSNRLLILDLGSSTISCSMSVVTAAMRNLSLTAPIDVWHQRLGHPGHHIEEKLVQQQQIFLPKSSSSRSSCEVCSQAKATRREWVNPQATRFSAPFAHVCWDLFHMGPALGRPSTSFSVRICAATSMVILGTPPSKNKGDLLQEVRHFDHFLQRRYDLLIRCWQSDNEPGLPLQTYLEDYGVETILTSPHTPHENGKAERIGAAIKQLMAAIFIQTGLPTELWPWIANLATFLYNRQPKELLGYKSPLHTFNLWLRTNRPTVFAGIECNPPNLTCTRVPGCRAYACTADYLKGKKPVSQPKAHIGYFVGYKSSTQYWIWVPQLRRVINTPHVTFDETKLFRDDTLPLPLPLPEVASLQLSIESICEKADDESNNVVNPIHQQFGSVLERYTADTSLPKGSTPSELYEPIMQRQLHTPDPTPERDLAAPGFSHREAAPGSSHSEATPGSSHSAPMPADNLQPLSADLDTRHILAGKRERKPRSFAAALAAAVIAHDTSGDDPPSVPQNVREARRHKFAIEWAQSEKKELDTLMQNGTYEEVSVDDLPAEVQVLDLTWVYKYKPEATTIFKARLCVRGDQQENTLLSVYAATLSATSYRCLLAIANKFCLRIDQFDAVSAFANSPLDEVVYTKLPPGCMKQGVVWRLYKALYGLRRSPLLWYKLLREACENLGLKALTEESCVLTDGKITVFFYVDDINIMYHPRDDRRAHEIAAGLRSRFDLTGGLPISNFLKIRVTRDYFGRHLYLNQQSYIEATALKFGVTDGPHLPLSPLPSAKLPARDHTSVATKLERRAYLQIIGSVIYATYMTRPDAAFSASFLAQFLLNPAPEHYAAAIHLLGYLLRTKQQAIHFDGSCNTFNAFADASFADHPDRTSSQGYIFTLFGGAIAWKAAKQHFVSLSSTEAELRSLSAAAQELVAVDRLLQQIGLTLERSLSLCCDNLQTVRLLNLDTAKLTTKIRHIDIHKEWLRQEVQQGRLQVNWIPAKEMAADGLTKRLSATDQEAFLLLIGLTTIPSILC